MLKTTTKNVKDAFSRSFFEAHAEAQRRRRESAGDEFITRIEKNPYGDGYCVRSIPAEFVIGDELSLPGSMDASPTAWGK